MHRFCFFDPNVSMKYWRKICQGALPRGTKGSQRVISSAGQIWWFGGYSHKNYCLNHQKIASVGLAMRGSG